VDINFNTNTATAIPFTQKTNVITDTARMLVRRVHRSEHQRHLRLLPPAAARSGQAPTPTTRSRRTAEPRGARRRNSTPPPQRVGDLVRVGRHGHAQHPGVVRGNRQ
jgi:hypothetical protein